MDFVIRFAFFELGGIFFCCSFDTPPLNAGSYHRLSYFFLLWVETCTQHAYRVALVNVIIPFKVTSYILLTRAFNTKCADWCFRQP